MGKISSFQCSTHYARDAATDPGEAKRLAPEMDAPLYRTGCSSNERCNNTPAKPSASAIGMPDRMCDGRAQPAELLQHNVHELRERELFVLAVAFLRPTSWSTRSGNQFRCK